MANEHKDGTQTENTKHLGTETFGQMEIRNAVIAAVGATEVTPKALLHLSQTFGAEIAQKIASNATLKTPEIPETMEEEKPKTLPPINPVPSANWDRPATNSKDPV